ncbi:hypothetical protein ASD31_04845 [Rhizobium sp. Root482]|nr:hypothetical protein ASD31_04845 [Rhizobium sp. Root482]
MNVSVFLMPLGRLPCEADARTDRQCLAAAGMRVMAEGFIFGARLFARGSGQSKAGQTGCYCRLVRRG